MFGNTVSWAGAALMATSVGMADTPFREPAVIGWKLGLQAYSFRNLSLVETIHKARELGIPYLEAYPGQKVAPDLDERFTHTCSEAAREAVRAALAETGVKLHLFGVCDLGADEASARQVFEFAKAMGIAILTAEPNPRSMYDLDRLTREFGIKVAIHNHPQPSHYWDPQVLLNTVREHSDRIGSCADVGHWARSGIDAVHGLRLLEGRLISLHFKDIEAVGEPKAEDVIWGTGALNVRALLEELNRQGFQGVFSIEYEVLDDRLTDNVRQCVEWFLRTADEIAKSGR